MSELVPVGERGLTLPRFHVWGVQWVGMEEQPWLSRVGWEHLHLQYLLSG